jgi:hypothetical protein
MRRGHFARQKLLDGSAPATIQTNRLAAGYRFSLCLLRIRVQMLSRLADRIRREILVESGSNLFQATIEIRIQRCHYR